MYDIDDIDLSGYRFTVKCRDPWIIVVHDLISDEEIAHLLSLAERRFQRSYVVGKHDANTIDGRRTSSTCMFAKGESPILDEIEQRVGKISRLPRLHQEPFQLVKYEAGQQYAPHFDYFHPDEPYAEKEIFTRGQRCLTILAYLVEPLSGGTTYFPRLSLHIPAVKGSAILWFNTDRDGNVDPRTEHGGMPVFAGTKVAMNMWMRTKPYA